MPDKGTCKSCHASIYWIRSAKNGTPIPVDIQRRTIITEDGKYVSGHETHFATCPNAAEHRKPAEPKGGN